MKTILAVLLSTTLGQSFASPALAPAAGAATVRFTSTETATLVDYLTLPVSGIGACPSGSQVTVTVTVTEWAECTPALASNASPSVYGVTQQTQVSSFIVPPLFLSGAQSTKTAAGHTSLHGPDTLFSTLTTVGSAPGAVMSPQLAASFVRSGSSARGTSTAQPALASTTATRSGNANSLPTNTIIQNLKPVDPIYTALALYSHNVHRENHTDTGPLSWNTTLVQYAREKASTCIWDETVPADAVGVGMNLAEGTYIGAANVTATIEDMWYNSEISLFPGYGLADPDMSDFNDWGHFTQVVWKATMSVGCWSSACSRRDGTANEIGSGFFTVCMYYPEGNVAGEYAEQVAKPRGRATIHGL